MPDIPTPGELAYTAYHQGAPLPWALLPAYEQAQWEAAAEAVREDTPRFQFVLGQQVRWQVDPDLVWHITYRAVHEDREGLRLSYGIRREWTSRMAEEADLSAWEDARPPAGDDRDAAPEA